jgi:hypothetical protein
VENFVLVIGFGASVVEVDALRADIANFAEVGEVQFDGHDRRVWVKSEKISAKRMAALLAASIASYGLSSVVRFWSYKA